MLLIHNNKQFIEALEYPGVHTCDKSQTVVINHQSIIIYQRGGDLSKGEHRHPLLR